MKCLKLKNNELYPYIGKLLPLYKILRNKSVTMKEIIDEAPAETINYLLFDGDKLVANARVFKNISFKNYSRSYEQVASVIVDEKSRGKGYGKKLMKIITNNHKKLILDTFLSWTPAVRLYLSSGFKIKDTGKHGNDYLVVFVKQ